MGPIIARPNRPWLNNDERNAWITANEQAQEQQWRERWRQWDSEPQTASSVVAFRHPQSDRVDRRMFGATNVQSWLRISKTW